MTSTSIKDRFERFTYEEQARRLNEAYEWLAGFGIRIAPSKLHHYRKIIDCLAEHQRLGNLQWADLPFSFSDAITTFGEVNEILRIHRGLVGLNAAGLGSKIKTLLSGTQGRPPADILDPARDYAFELMTAARFNSAGFSIDLSGAADISVDVGGGMRLFVECKRIRSVSAIRKRVREALHQISRRIRKMEQPELGRGLLAVSITDCYNPEHMIVPQPSHEHIRAVLGNLMDGFIRRHGGLWQGAGNAQLLGTLVEFAAVGIVEHDNLPVTCVETAFNNAHPLETKESRLLFAIGERLADGL